MPGSPEDLLLDFLEYLGIRSASSLNQELSSGYWRLMNYYLLKATVLLDRFALV